ncbi:hypothetical protein [Microbacterium jejuense]|uniref:hypothetical protein n=1 Tax=Microbacterium jejuense TaxID=1263637 RepID=UPI0031ED7689
MLTHLPHGAGNTRRQRIALFARRISERLRAGADENTLAVAVDLVRLHVDLDRVPLDGKRGQVVSLVGEAEVGRPLHEARPRVQPQPELAFLVRVQRQVPCGRRVALEEPGERLAGVHDAEVAGVVDEFLVTVRGRRCGRDEPERDRVEQAKERLVRLRTERPEHRCFVQRHRFEQ